jgi:hypothetical protein
MKTTLLLAGAALALSAFAAETIPTLKSSAPFKGAGNVPVQRVAEPPPFSSPQTMQAEFVRRFEASPGFGLQRVLRPIFLAPTPALVWNDTTYPIAPPELIGLEDDPVAYSPREHAYRFPVSTNETRSLRSEVRKRFQSRPLTEVETNAVLALRSGRDLVILTNSVESAEAAVERLITPPELLVVGALRAKKDCAACHQCEQGSLLGAFTYRLTPLGPVSGGINSPAADSNLLARLTASLPLMRSKL